MASSDLADVTALSPSAIGAIAHRVGNARTGDARAAAELGARVALVCAKFNGAVTMRLVEGALAALVDHGVPSSLVTVLWVPGAFELPVAARRLATSGTVDAVIALGAVIRGETAHFEHVAGPCAMGLQWVALQTGVPVVLGVLTTENLEQALVRSEHDQTNKGYEAAVTALEMVDLLGSGLLGSGPEEAGA